MIGKEGKSAVGTLVERQTRYLMLLHLPRGRTAAHVGDALAGRITELPRALRRSQLRLPPRVLVWLRPQGPDYAAIPAGAGARGPARE